MYINVATKALNLFNSFQRATADAKSKALANPLFSWHVSYFTYRRKKNLIFLNDASTLAVVLYDVNAKNKANIKERFEQVLAGVWDGLGLDKTLLADYLKVAGDWQINKSIDRSAVGCVSLLCREVGEPLIEMVDEQAMAETMTSRLRRKGKDYLHETDTIKLFREAAPFKWQKAQDTAKPVIDQKELREVIRRLRKNTQANIDDFTPEQFDNLVRDIQNNNDQLIAAFIEAVKDEHAEKTIRRYKDNLSFYLNEWLAYHIQTIMSIESTAIADLLYHGSSEYEVKQIRAAMKKLLKFLADNKVVSSEWYQDRKVMLNNEDLSADDLELIDEDDDENWSKMDNLMFNDAGDPTLPTIFSKETDRLIDDYFAAFASLYGIIPSHQAFQIIKAQNPTIDLSLDRYLTYIMQRVGNRNLRYLVLNLAEMAEEVKLDADFNNEFYIIYPTIIADSNRLINIYNHQLGLQYYVPAKHDLLRFKEDGFFDLGEYQAQLEKIFATEYRLDATNLYAAVYLSLFGLKLDPYNDLDLAGMTKATNKVIFMLNDAIHLGIEKNKKHEALIKLLMVIESNIRRPWDRGMNSTEMIATPTIQELVTGDGPILSDELKAKIHNGQVDRQELIAAIASNDELSSEEITSLQNEIKKIK